MLGASGTKRRLPGRMSTIGPDIRGAGDVRRVAGYKNLEIETIDARSQERGVEPDEAGSEG